MNYIAMQSGSGYDEQGTRRHHSDRGPLVELIVGICQSIADLFKPMFRKFQRKPVLAGTIQLTRETKLALAKDPSASPEMLRTLLTDSDSQIRLELIHNGALPVALLYALTTDTDRFVAAQAVVKLDQR
ncbi:MAG: hypothetical protein K2W95_30245 [Candidatus Obscuribacterales bacterium]|nr:hypothetical protein [Candidatus Obscuribacterales bacterium]